jgi:intracellular septation protein A
MALKSSTMAWIFFLFAALAGGCSLFFQSVVFEYVTFSPAIVDWLWLLLLWMSGLVLCIVFVVLGIRELRQSSRGSK